MACLQAAGRVKYVLAVRMVRARSLLAALLARLAAVSWARYCSPHCAAVTPSLNTISIKWHLRVSCIHDLFERTKVREDFTITDHGEGPFV